MYEFLKYYHLDGPVIATKADKVSKREAQKQVIRKTLGMEPEDVIIPVSALKKTGVDKVLDAMETIIGAE